LTTVLKEVIREKKKHAAAVFSVDGHMRPTPLAGAETLEIIRMS
jgi:hypothetical protein